MPCSQNESRKPCGDLRAGSVGSVERHAEILEELRAVGQHAGANLVEHFDRRGRRDWPRVFSINGGIAPISTALATRFVPWRPI